VTSVRPGTWAMLGLAAAGVTLARVDPWSEDRVVAPLTSNRTGARRLMPQLGEVDVAVAMIALQPPSGPTVYLEPSPAGGHQVRAGEQVLGPADPEAVEGLWSSLRMATTLRAVAEGTESDLGVGGQLTLSWPGQERRLALGSATVDEVGVYGALQGGAEGTSGLWVVERELAVLLAQSSRAWLARRAVVIETSHLERAVFAEGMALSRDASGLWQGGGATLDPHAVRTRLQRIVSARMDPMLEPSPEDTVQPWVTLGSIAGTQTALSLGGPCPSRADRVVLHRGPGLLGCIDAALAAPWTLSPLVHPNLAPHLYGDVMSIEQVVPIARTLSRHGGGWRLTETIDGRDLLTEVDEAEVFRWYGALHDAEVELQPEPLPETPPEVTYAISVAQGVTMKLSCWAPSEDGTRNCRRGEGPVLSVRAPLGELALSPELFSDRRIVTGLSIDDVRAIEILPGGGRPTARTERQSAHFDLGVWRLDAPVHPDGDDAMDTTKFDAMMVAVAGLRAETWAAAPSSEPLRTIRIDQAAHADAAETVEVALYDGCVVVVPGRRPGVVSESTCRRLSASLLFGDPLSAWINNAVALELTEQDGPTTRLQRAGEAWVREDGLPMGPLAERVDGMRAWRADDVVHGAATGPTLSTLRVRPRQGAAFDVSVGADWAQISGADWRYVGPDFASP